MCTVSFVNTKGKIVLTSNRDEKTIRPIAITPKIYRIKGKNMIFPKDSKAGGSWCVLDEKGTVLILLNGASIKHEVKAAYRKSRGLIVLDIISHVSPLALWQDINLEDIEPFTLVLYQEKRLFQLRWNGEEKESIELDPTKNYIWSSVTLYSEEISIERASWFAAFLENQPKNLSSQMIRFHKYTQEENKENGLVINRNNAIRTVSITQVVFEKNKMSIGYHDLVANVESLTSFIVI